MKVRYSDQEHLHLDADELFNLLKEFQNKDQIDFYVETDYCFLIFYWYENTELWVEILDGNPAWIMSEIYLTEVKDILKIAYTDGNFGYFIPTTNEKWDSYRAGVLDE